MNFVISVGNLISNAIIYSVLCLHFPINWFDRGNGSAENNMQQIIIMKMYIVHVGLLETQDGFSRRN